MFNCSPVKNGLIPAVVQTVSAWFINDGFDFVFALWCLVPCVLPHGSDVFVHVPPRGAHYRQKSGKTGNLEKKMSKIREFYKHVREISGNFQPVS